MRPPMQSAALQQNESSRQQQQQQQQQQQNPPQQIHQTQLLTPETAADLAILHPQRQQQRKLQQREILVENHFNNTFTVTSATIKTKRHLSLPARQTPTPPYQQHFVGSRNSFQFQNDDDDHNHDHDEQNNDDEGVDDSIRLVDLSSSPPPAPHRSQSSRNAPPSSRSSIISDYPFSLSSSCSEDDASLSGDKLLLQHYSSRANTFDDAAEHFIINFPADSPSAHQLPNNDCIINLPLSETEPLLTNINSAIAGDTKRRAICLNKNSASLIFTKKEIPPAIATRNYSPATAIAISTSNNNCSSHRRVVNNACNIGASSTASGLANSQRRHHHSLRASNERSSSSSNSLNNSNNRKQTNKHLPATYHQKQRRSLQLNYNNNLVTTSTCSANNNYCCSAGSLTGIKGNGASFCDTVLHKHHSGLTSPIASNTALTATATTTTTAAATRKQHAYSWYAPVYSALEEELEQDSRDSSPIHNLANTKKQHTKHYQQQRSSHTGGAAAVTDNETVALLETRNQINIQPQLHAQAQTQQRDGNGGIRRQQQQQQQQTGTAAQAPNSLALQQPLNAGVAHSGGFVVGSASSDFGSYDGNEGPHAGSLGLAGGPLPRRRRFENFLKSLVGLKTTTTMANGGGRVGSDAATTMPAAIQMQLPASPEITITRTPSEQNVVVMRDPAGRCHQQQTRHSRQLSGGSSSCDGEKLMTNGGGGGSTSSLNVVQQKLWNILRRESSATSLHQDQTMTATATTPTIVQYMAGGNNGSGTGMRKCETVLALTRQTHSLCSPVLGVAPPTTTGPGGSCNGSRGSGIFSANGVEQIRPLNRLRNSVVSINAAATCSRCSSLLSLAASGSRYSLNVAATYGGGGGGGGAFVNTTPSSTSVSQQQLHVQFSQQPSQHLQRPSSQRQSSTVSSSSLNCSLTHSRDNVDGGVGASHQAGGSSISNRSSCGSSHCSRKSSSGIVNSLPHSASNSPPSNVTNTTTATLNSSYTPTPAPTAANALNTNTNDDDGEGIILGFPSASSSLSTHSSTSSPTSGATPAAYPLTVTSLLATASNEERDTVKVASTSSSDIAPTVVRPFQLFTCKLCLVDVESASEATTLVQCACEFCTECMKAYVDFEISEGAYEISCPDAQCPAQGILTLPEIANLTTGNLMKKHHRYRLNREIELDKTRTWCPRAGCETVCLVGATTTNTNSSSTAAVAVAGTLATSHSDAAAPSTSTSISTNIAASTSNSGAALSVAATAQSPVVVSGDANSQSLCAVLCPSCKDEFCSACKKTWHPNLSCEENSRRLVADGQDDIGIPFDNDLIKCCPMCAVPIEKDEGCAQMMCKRCKHVFCWYCLASLDDDFLLRHYDKGPCKNKLGHSRASVVWHRAQVIGIFAGFGILLLVASPLLLLAAPCIICCKCRSCSGGSKIDEGDGELDEATALQS